MAQVISRFVNTPYLPVLGPVHPNEVRDELLLTLFNAGGVLLPYDKATRWGSIPTETITGYETTDTMLCIATETAGKHKRQYIYTDSKGLPGSGGYSETITFSQASRALRKGEHGSVIFLDDFSRRIEKGQLDDAICLLSDLSSEQQDNFANYLGGDPAVYGLEVAVQKEKENPGGFPILVYVKSDAILGVLGPLNVLEDSVGVKRLLPCYFIVSPEHRKQGIGTHLWYAMRTWAITAGANYTILQAELGGDAERFYGSNGLQKLGHVYRSRTN